MRLSLRRADEGSLPLAMLVVMVVLSLSATMAPIVVRQIKNTQGYDQRGASLDAAQAGLDVMMARVRAAADDEQNGYLENMPPCTMAGTIGATGGNVDSTYKVTVVYRDRDGVEMGGCAVNDVPTTAVVTATGFDGTSTRTLTATYVFSTSNTNIPGGRIKISVSSVRENTVLVDQCLDVGTSAASPPRGTAITTKTCNGSSQQQFGYTADLYLKLIYSESSTAPLGMCLFANSTRVSGTTPVVLQDCPSIRTTTFQWALDGNSVFHATTSASKSDGSYCMNIKNPGTDPAVILAGCGASNAKNQWYSAPGVGAGMAGDSTNQLVNYKQFSRCLDVTSKNMGSSYMIAWFCKQDPGALVDFNQQWVHPVPVLPAISKSGPIVVNNYSANSNSNMTSPSNIHDYDYCLKSPGTVSSTSWATVVSCKDTAAKAQTEVVWTVYHDTGDYGTSYRIMDYKGNCLQPTEQGTNVSNDFHGDGTSKVKVAKCSTADIQKWNAPANVNQPSPITNLTEK